MSGSFYSYFLRLIIIPCGGRSKRPKLLATSYSTIMSVGREPIEHYSAYNRQKLDNKKKDR